MKIYIAEDEPLAASKLKLFLEKLDANGDISLHDNGVSLLAAVERQSPDLLFLDIQMPALNGMQVLERLNPDIPVVITSAYDQYALDSFSYNVIDYLLKPYTLERLKKALEKAQTSIRLKQLDQQSQARMLSIRSDGQNIQLKEDSILYLESIKDYVRVVTTEGQQYLTLCTLSHLEEELSDELFSRVHRSFVVNTSHITSSSSQSLTLSGGQEIPIGKTYRKH